MFRTISVPKMSDFTKYFLYHASLRCIRTKILHSIYKDRISQLSLCKL